MAKKTKINMTKFDKGESIPVGCNTGQHDFDKESIELESHGDLTRIKMKCRICGRPGQDEYPLNINDLMDGNNQKQTQQPTQQVEQEQEVIQQKVYIKKEVTINDRVNVQKANDSFWDDIKNG